MNGRTRSKEVVHRDEAPVFEFDPRAKSYIESIKNLPPDQATFSLNGFTSEALAIFIQGITPIVEYYVRANFGPDTDKTLGNIKQPWTAMDLAEIFRLHFPAFVDCGVRAPVRALGTTLGDLVKDLEYKLGKGLIISSFKLVQLCLEGMRMFPKERPRHTLYIPRIDYEAMIMQLTQDRKTMKKCWKQCTKYIDMNVNPPKRTESGWNDNSYSKLTPSDIPHKTTPETPSHQASPSTKNNIVLGLPESLLDEDDQGLGRVMERYEVKGNFDRDEFLRDLEERIEKEWRLHDDPETFHASNSAKISPSSFPGADGWYT
eukprot:g3817.t1